MKIYDKLIIKIDTGEVMQEKFHEYSGEVAYCGSGGGSKSTVDKEYNRRMAAVMEKQQAMADYYMEHWKGAPKEYELAQIEANMGLMPQQVGLEKARMGFETKGMEYGLDALKYQQEGREQASEWYKGFKPVQQQYMQEASGGIDISKRRSEAVAGVEHQFGQMMPQYERSLSRRGLKMGSSDLRQMAIDKAVAKAGASTMAKNIGEAEQFDRLSGAMNLQYRRPQ